jgi:hypothetical protein
VPPDSGGSVLFENSALNRVSANGAFAVETTTRGDGTEVAVVVWRVGSSGIRMGVDTAGTWLSNVQDLAGVTIAPFATTAPSDGTQLIALSRIGDGQALSLIYRSATGTLVEHTMTWSGITPVWTGPSTLPVPTQFTGSPGSVRLASSTLSITPGGLPVAPGVILAVTRPPASMGSPPSLELWLRSSGLPTGSWLLYTTSTLGGSAATAFRGQPQLAISPIRRGVAPGTLQNHLWTTVTTDVQMRVHIRRSDPGVIQSSSASGADWIRLEANRDVSASATPSLLRDDRQPAGLRGIIPDLQAQGCPANGCPNGEVCTALTSGSFCVVPGGRFVRVNEYQSIGMDGVIPGILESFNEWPQFQRTFCSTIRGQRSHAPAPWTGESGDSCIDAPVY